MLCATLKDLKLRLFLDLESEDFIEQFHRTEVVDNCDVFGRHLKESGDSSSSTPTHGHNGDLRNTANTLGPVKIDKLHKTLYKNK